MIVIVAAVTTILLLTQIRRVMQITQQVQQKNRRDGHCTYNATTWRAYVTIAAVQNTTVNPVCVFERHVIISYVKLLRIAQQCLYGEFISPATIKCIRSSCKFADAALKQKNFRLLVAFFRRTVCLNISWWQISRCAVLFVSVAIKHFTRRDGLNQLGRNKY
jgi:hypothetical protein